MKQILKLPKAAYDVIENYKCLNIGGKKIRSPYFMNVKKQRGGLRVMVGKGSPGEIEREVQVMAQLKGFDLAGADEQQIRKFMQDRDIGVDCSAFTVHVISKILEEQEHHNPAAYLKFRNNSLISRIRRYFRPVENISADLLTNEDNTEKVIDLNDIKPGDFIRLKGKQRNSDHILIISKVVLTDDVIQQFEYVHSTREYGDENGIVTGRVEVSHPDGELKDQKWDEERQYNNLLKDYDDNGVRRLRKVTIDFDTENVAD
ncbi:MAG: hypothetical protein ACE5DX_00645 [Candidatus Dojkabacteria bacterium]